MKLRQYSTLRATFSSENDIKQILLRRNTAPAISHSHFTVPDAVKLYYSSSRLLKQRYAAVETVGNTRLLIRVFGRRRIFVK